MPDLILLSGEIQMDKSTPAIFHRAATLAGQPADACLYVGDEQAERRNARLAGLKTRRSPQEALDTLTATTPISPVAGLTGLQACIDDVIAAARDNTPGPEEPNNYQQLLGRLETAKLDLPPAYRERVAEPYLTELRRIGQAGFNQVMARDLKRESNAGLMFDIAQAILQNGENFQHDATDAFQEVLSDLYDGFLSADVRTKLKLPTRTVLAPLVKWGNPSSGPYTWPLSAAGPTFNVQSAVVSLPPSNAAKGIFAWAALPHETGHDIMGADAGLQEEIAQAVYTALTAAKVGSGLASYWSERIDETAADVMGILNSGPAAGMGLVVYFRGLNGDWHNSPRLRNDGPADDPHPADALRGLLAAATVRLLSFDGAASWGDIIESETRKDIQQITVAGTPVTLARARQSCEIVASIIAATRMKKLNNYTLLTLQNWRNEDEAIAQELGKALVNQTPIDASRAKGVYAAHVVAGATLAALSGAEQPSTLFPRMVAVLKTMHDANAAWGPLFVAHPGDITRDFCIQR